MKARISLILLAISIAANLALVAIYLDRDSVAPWGKPASPPEPTTNPAALPPRPRSNPAQPPGPAAAPAPIPAPSPNSSDLRSVRLALISAGIPEDLANLVIATMAEDKHGYADLKKEWDAAPRADRDSHSKKIADALAAGHAEYRSIVPEKDIEEIRREKQRQSQILKYGDIPLETMSRVQALESAHRDKSDYELAQELHGFLSAAQVDDYLRYNSMLSKVIQGTLNRIDVDESTYLELLQVAVSREQTLASKSLPKDLADRNRSLESVAAYRRILGDEKFVQIIDRIDADSASLDSAYHAAGVSIAARADLFMDAYRPRQNFWLAGDRQNAPVIARELRQALIAKAGLTLEQVAAFDQTRLGGALKAGNLSGWGGSIPSR